MTDYLDNSMTVTEATIWQFLKDNFAGPDNALPSATIIARLYLRHHIKIDDRTFRQTVSDLVTRFKKPICTTPANGYYVARTSRDRDLAINHLKSIGAAAFERARALEETETLERQETLF